MKELKQQLNSIDGVYYADIQEPNYLVLKYMDTMQVPRDIFNCIKACGYEVDKVLSKDEELPVSKYNDITCTQELSVPAHTYLNLTLKEVE